MNSCHFCDTILIKTHDRESCGQEKQPACRLPRVYYTRRDCIQKMDDKTITFTQLKSFPYHSYNPFPKVSHISISVDGVANLLHNLNPHKATGSDGIPAYFLKECSIEIAPILTLIFQCSIQQGSMPDEWKTANIIPIFKKGDRTDTGNYRPISLTSICSKLLEHIIYVTFQVKTSLVHT